MGREIKRVPVDFAWPMEARWPGYLAEERVEPPTGEGWQVWETVSEGSPVSPVFATPEDLARYLSDHGDAWEQRRAAEGRGWGKPSYESALKFVTSGWAPSASFSPSTGLLDSYGSKVQR